ncbi:MAG: tripartite tricarboxylate transporter substrate binding protein [Pseudomonadota bacterium]
MNTNRRHALAAIASLAATPWAASNAFAQAWPNKPIRMIVPYAAGGGTDAFARTVAPRMGDILGQQIIVDNRPGAGSAIGATAAATSPGDGYTLLLGDSATYAVNRSLYPKLGYDSFKDLSPVSLTARFGLVLAVNPSVPAKNLAEFVALAKAKPGQLSYGTPGNGTPHHLAMELLMQRTGISLVHIPYKGAGPAVQDMLGGQLQVLMTDLPTAAQHLKAGTVRAIASLGEKRLAATPDLATVAESGYPGFDAWAWQGFSVPSSTPAPIVAALNAAYIKVAAEPSMRQKMTEFGGELTPSTPAAMDAYMRAEAVKWARTIQDGKIKVE